MIVRINYMYEDDCDFEDFEEGERFSVSSDALTIGFQILGTPDDEEALDGREGELSSDFEYELQMALLNRNLKAQCETIFMMPTLKNSFVASSLVKEVARLHGDFEQYVPEPVAKAVKAKLYS